MESFSKGLVFEGKEEYLVDFVSREVSISKQFVKQLLSKGSVWLKRASSSLKRVRKAKFLLLKGDKVEVHYSSKIQDLDVEKLCYPVGDFKEWGVWFKGVNVLSQGTKYGDSNSILRLLEKQKPNVHMINRIDKEASGLMVFAYSKKIAATLSKIWGEESTEKTYQIVVKGNMAKKFPKKGKITKKIQGKDSLTLFDVQKAQKEFSFVLATLKTGRFHQIRKPKKDGSIPFVLSESGNYLKGDGTIFVVSGGGGAYLKPFADQQGYKKRTAPKAVFDALAKRALMNHFLILGAVLFATGVYGVLARRNGVMVLMSIELMLNAVNINLVAFGTLTDDVGGAVFALFTIAVAAAEVGIGLAIVLLMYRNRRSIDLTEIDLMRG